MSDSIPVVLVRHGEAASTWGESADPGLSEKGKQQAEAVVQTLLGRFKSESPSLLSSPLLRAQETAAPLAAAMGVDVRIDERFREIPSPVPLSERQNWLREFMRGNWADQDALLHAWRERLVTAVQDTGRPTIVFTHFLVINALVGWSDQRTETLVCWPDNASVTVLKRGTDAFSVQELGEQMRTRVN